MAVTARPSYGEVRLCENPEKQKMEVDRTVCSLVSSCWAFWRQTAAIR